MKSILIILAVGLFSFAHDDGHGPKLGDQPKFGGKVSAVIDKAEINKGTKAKMLYKAELTKNNKNFIRVYLYDDKMKPLDIASLGDSSGALMFKDRKTKKWVNHKFNLKKEKDHYSGQLPTKPRRPFSVDVTIKEKGKSLFMAFDNLN